MKKIINLISVIFFLIVSVSPSVGWAQGSWREKLRERWRQRIGKKQTTEKSYREHPLADLEHKQITHGGLQRSYHMYVPAKVKKAKDKYPLVIMLHGGGSTAEYMPTFTGFNRLAREQKFMVVYPEGIEKHWNDGRGVQEYKCQRENIDDIGFLSAMIDQVTAQYPVDLERVYVTGVSNGGIMTHRVAVDLSHKIAAAAMVIGNAPEPHFSQAIPSNPVPMLIMNGTKDKFVRWEGGEVGRISTILGSKALRPPPGRVASTEQTVNFWRTHNKCETSTQTSYKPNRDPNDGVRVRVESYKDKAGKVMVVLYAIEGGGHVWPGVPEQMHMQQFPEQAAKKAIGPTCYDINGTQEIYDFFKQYSRNR